MFYHDQTRATGFITTTICSLVSKMLMPKIILSKPWNKSWSAALRFVGRINTDQRKIIAFCKTMAVAYSLIIIIQWCLRWAIRRELYGIYIALESINVTSEIIQHQQIASICRIGWKLLCHAHSSTVQRVGSPNISISSARIWSFEFHLKSVYVIVIVLNTNQCAKDQMKMRTNHNSTASLINTYIDAVQTVPFWIDSLWIHINMLCSTPCDAHILSSNVPSVTGKKSNMSNDLIRFCAINPLQIRNIHSSQHIITICMSVIVTHRVQIGFDFLGIRSIGVIFDLSHYEHYGCLNFD